MHALLFGFSLGFSLILAIGAQNAFVLKQGLRDEHVYLDTVVLLGSVSTQFSEQIIYFKGSAMAASFVFFFALGSGARLLRPVFALARAWRVFDFLIGCVMWAIALRLVTMA